MELLNVLHSIFPGFNLDLNKPKLSKNKAVNRQSDKFAASSNTYDYVFLSRSPIEFLRTIYNGVPLNSEKKKHMFKKYILTPLPFC